MNCEIPLGGTERPQGIPTEVSLPNGLSGHSRRIRKREGVECLTAGILWTERVEWDTRYQVRPNLRETVKKNGKPGIKNTHRRSGTTLNDALERPSTQNGARESVDL